MPDDQRGFTCGDYKIGLLAATGEERSLIEKEHTDFTHYLAGFKPMKELADPWRDSKTGIICFADRKAFTLPLDVGLLLQKVFSFNQAFNYPKEEEAIASSDITKAPFVIPRALLECGRISSVIRPAVLFADR